MAYCPVSIVVAQGHSCVREASACQPTFQSKLTAERGALAKGKEPEDTYVTAILAAQVAAEEAHWELERSISSRATA
ncbi:hypothetical protein AEGHOMDF_4100 [Methylobacterium soli]|nr:hypothetical protein AEGHOMDF_4100 [Methylobacterium soli]